MKFWAITFNTFRETIRDRVLYNLLVFALLMIILSMVLGKLSFAEQERITIDIGLTTISLFGILMAVFLGIGLVSKEIERKTIHTLIAKPVPRWLFLLGRFSGLLLTIGVNILIMTAAFGLIMVYFNYPERGFIWPLTWPIIQTLILILVELSIITAAAMLFSTFSTPTLSAIFTLCFFVIGRFTAGIREFGEISPDPVFYWGAKILYYAVPNLRDYVPIEAALYGDGLSSPLFFTLLLKGILTVAFLLVVAAGVFERRDFV